MRFLSGFSALCIGILFLTTVNGDNWGVIVAGSNGFYNYRHQTDACHAFHVLHDHGVPADKIIVMIYDDIANDPNNPYPGQLFNKPTSAGIPVRFINDHFEYKSRFCCMSLSVRCREWMFMMDVKRITLVMM
jgi:glycosylphosphatidylinositol transamidase (GPIT) subunit GPI8